MAQDGDTGHPLWPASRTSIAFLGHVACPSLLTAQPRFYTHHVFSVPDQTFQKITPSFLPMEEERETVTQLDSLVVHKYISVYIKGDASLLIQAAL